MTCKVGEACCRKDREVVTFDFVSARGAKNERFRGRMSSNWEEVSVEGPLAQGSSFLGWVMELDVERRPNCFEEGQISSASKDPLEVGRPMSEFLKGPTMVGRSSVKALKGVGLAGAFETLTAGGQTGMILASRWGHLHRCQIMQGLPTKLCWRRSPIHRLSSLFFVLFGEAGFLFFFYSFWAGWGNRHH